MYLSFLFKTVPLVLSLVPFGDSSFFMYNVDELYAPLHGATLALC